MAKTTSAERAMKRLKRLDALAQQFGYQTWGRLSTAVLRGDAVITVKKIEANIVQE